MDDLLDIEPPEEEMFRFEWDPRVLDTSLYQRDDGAIDSARVFLGFRAGYARPPTIHDFRAEGLHLIGMFPTCPFSRNSYQINIWLDKLCSSTQRRQHDAHISFGAQ